MLAAAALAACMNTSPAPPAVAIVIDDLGNRHAYDHAALALPAPLTYAILPFSPLTQALAERAAEAREREVLLHLPMEAHERNHLLGPGALMMDMSETDFAHAVERAIADVPHLVGINNHMGSRLTADRTRMRWLMGQLRRHGGLLFLDSRTTGQSAARAAAAASGVRYLERDVFLDNRRGEAAISKRLDQLVALARARGDAVGIGHPYPETLAVLARRLPTLSAVRLVRLTELLSLRECRTAGGDMAGTAVSETATRELADRGADLLVAPERGNDHRTAESAE